MLIPDKDQVVSDPLLGSYYSKLIVVYLHSVHIRCFLSVACKNPVKPHTFPKITDDVCYILSYC